MLGLAKQAQRADRWQSQLHTQRQVPQPSQVRRARARAPRGQMPWITEKREDGPQVQQEDWCSAGCPGWVEPEILISPLHQGPSYLELQLMQSRKCYNLDLEKHNKWNIRQVCAPAHTGLCKHLCVCRHMYPCFLHSGIPQVCVLLPQIPKSSEKVQTHRFRDSFSLPKRKTSQESLLEESHTTKSHCA